MDMTGYLTINGVDVWTQFGAFLAETSPEEHSNMDASLRMPKAKEVTTVDFREQHGVSIPQSPDVKLDKIERTLRFWLSADSNVECPVPVLRAVRIARIGSPHAEAERLP